MSGQRESKQVYLSFIKDFPSSSRRDIELENEHLRLNNKQLSSELNDFKVKCANLQKNVDSLTEELFQLQTKNNTLQSSLSKVLNELKIGFLPNLLCLTNTCTNIITESSIMNNMSSQVRHSIKTQAVKPQIVNGNVLYNPTISLTRFDTNNVVNNSNQMSETESNTNEEEPVENMEDSGGIVDSQALDPRLSTILEDAENRTVQQQNSPIINGVFRDVKIFLQNITNVSEKDLSEVSKRNSLEAQVSSFHDMPSSTSSFTINLSREQDLREFGLSPTTSLATSTPIECGNRYSCRTDRRNLGNTSCFVTKTRNGRKVFSPQDVNNALNGTEDKIITPKNSPKLIVKLKNIDKENVEVNEDQARPSTSEKKTSKKKRSSKRATQIKQEPLTPESTPTNDRPKRKAKPVNLKEPSLHKKMRRSK